MRVLVTGASRGIGAAVARRFAREGAHVALLARSQTAPSHTQLEGTLVDVARDIEVLGGHALPLFADLRDASETSAAVRSALSALGGRLDVLVNNASVLDLSEKPSEHRASLCMDVNARGTLSVSLACREALCTAGGAVVTLSPPVRLDRPEWLAGHTHYTVSKYAMTLTTLGMAGEGIRANCVWPRHTVATAATRRLESQVPGAYTRGRSPDDVAEAVYVLATSTRSGEALLDDEVLPLPPSAAPLDLFV